MTYRLADGHDNEAGFVTVSLQPKSPGLLYPRRIVAASGAVYDDGAPFTYWIFSSLTPDQYSALLTEFGLASAITNEVTIRTTGLTRDFANYNGTIIRPQTGRDAKFDMAFFEDVRFLIKFLVAT
jgi:hypothetical protein